MATLVADGWERAENLGKRLCDGRTNQATDQRMDGQTEKCLKKSRDRDFVYSVFFFVFFSFFVNDIINFQWFEMRCFEEQLYLERVISHI